MKSIIIIALILLFSSSSLLAKKHFLHRPDHDYRQDTLRIELNTLIPIYYFDFIIEYNIDIIDYNKGDKIISKDRFEELLKKNGMAYRNYNSAIKYVYIYDLTFSLSMVLNIYAIYDIATTTIDAPRPYLLLALGVAGTYLSIHLISSSMDSARDALRIYNEEIYEEVREKYSWSLYFGATPQGIGLTLSF
jgi:hypothetical protein